MVNKLIQNILSMWTPGPIELVIIALVVILIFGKRLPEITKNVGKSFVEFRKGVKEAKDAEKHLESVKSTNGRCS